MSGAAFAERCRALRLLLVDADGVLTDGRILVFPGGEGRSFHVRDGLAIVMAREAGLKTGILSGRESEAVRARARELGMDVVREGAKDKARALREILDHEGLEARQVAYVGDDVNDIPVFDAVGLSGAPADAPFEVRAEAFMVLATPGGQGCVREFVEAILRARGDWERVSASLFPR